MKKPVNPSIPAGRQGNDIPRRTVIAGGLAAGLTLTLGTSMSRRAAATTGKRVFFGMIGTETNTFSPMPTGMETFMDSYMGMGELDDDSSPLVTPLRLAREVADRNDWEVIQGPITFAAPGGVTPRRVYEDLRAKFLADLEASLPIDIVALMLHGAMVAEGYDDCEGDLFKHIRRVVGDKAVVGSVFDAHAHLGPEMLEYADLLIPMKEYPHTDFVERSEELIALSAAAARGEIEPVMSVFDCRMIDAFHTPREPMRGFVDKMMALERSDADILSISLFQSFPWSDVPVMGAKMLVISDNRPDKGARVAEDLGRELFSLRGKVSEPKLSIDVAIDRALGVDGGPVVLADFADNPGGGAPCDSTFLLQGLLDRGITNAAFGRLYDPLALEQVKLRGEGSRFSLRIGGKLSRMSGQPVDLEIEVRKILKGEETGVHGEAGVWFEGAWVRGAGIDIVLGDSRGQTTEQTEFLRFGIPLNEKKIIIVKSSQHFYTSFAPIAKEILYVDSPGVLATDLTQLPFERIKRPMWPFDEQPFG